MWQRNVPDPRLVTTFVLLVMPAAVDGSGLSLPGRQDDRASGRRRQRSDPSAVTHNPAAIVRLRGLQVVVGLALDFRRNDVSGALDDYALQPDGDVSPSPSAYLVWRPPGQSKWAVGVGFDAPVWHRQEGPDSRFIFPYGIRFEATWRQVHPVVAFAVDDQWSLGAGVRHVSGTLREVYLTNLATGRGAGGRGGTYLVGGQRLARADVGGWAADASLSFRKAAWGFGAVYSTGTSLPGQADVQVRRLNTGPSEAQSRVAASLSYLLHAAPRGLGYDVAPELRVAGWMAPFSGLRVELDLARAFWSTTEWYRPQEPGACDASCTMFPPREWRNTLAVRLAAEHDMTKRFQLAVGIAKEPSPLPPNPGDRAELAGGLDPVGHLAALVRLEVRQLLLELRQAVLRDQCLAQSKPSSLKTLL